MTAAGSVRIVWKNGDVEPAIEVHVPSVERLLVGLPIDKVAETLQAFYAICACSHGAAAASALEAASGLAASADAGRARALLAAAESLRENALRVALAWPALLRQPADAARHRAFMRLVPCLRKALSTTGDPFMSGSDARIVDGNAVEDLIAESEQLLVREVFGEPLAVWMQRTSRAELIRWASFRRTPAARLVAMIEDEGWSDLGATRWAAWAGPPHTVESSQPLLPLDATLLARHAGHPMLAALMECTENAGLLVRVMARLVELASLPQYMRDILKMGAGSTVVCGESCGEAVVNSARGPLIHRARIENGAICSYTIVPPTRVNFAPRGAARAALRQLAEDLKTAGADHGQAAEILVGAFDPCVAYSLEVH